MYTVASHNNVLAVIPARGESKGLKSKNMLSLHGAPLVGWAISFADFMGFDAIVTTDDDEIEEFALSQGVEVKRTHSDYLHSDTCKSLDVWLDAWNKDLYPVSVLLEPTCPLRHAEDVERCLAMLDRYSSVLTVSPSTPKEKLFEIDSGLILNDGHVPRRQDCKEWFEVNGACYAMRADHDKEIIENAGAVIIHTPRISIDDAFDLWLCDIIMREAKTSSL